MGFLAKIAPRYACRREAWKQAYEIALAERRRNYDAGRYERSNRNWIATNASGELTDKGYRDTVRARSRDLERNSDLMMAQIHPWVRNVVGRGYVLEAKTDDENFNAAIESLWAKWIKKQNCDVYGAQSFWEIARMVVRRKKIDGGIIVMKCYTSDGIMPFKLQTIEVDELDETRMAPQYPGNKIVGGIEYNAQRRPVGYWFREYDLEGYQSLTPRFVEADRVIFYFSKTRPSQLREMPEMAHVLNRLKEVNGYIEAATVKERMAACLSVFIKSVAPIPRLGAPARTTADNSRDYNELKLTPGMVTALNAGEDLDVVNPASSATDANNFIKTMTRLICAGQGISYEAASRDLTETNYSSARQATIEDEETFGPEQEKMKDEFFDEVYEEFVANAVTSGLINCPDFFSNKDKYTAHAWNRKPKKWIDPVKETNANKTAIATGQRTLCELWAENGRDYKDVMDELKKLQDYAEEIGLKTDIITLQGGEKQDGTG